MNMIEMVAYTPGKVDHTLQEGLSLDDCFAGKYQGTNKLVELN